jgi:radical SAM superfamily enzyme YgiQ (UPF0313 family)
MTLGLIAMSGVRVHNEELMALGLTLPGFVERSEVIASLPSLGLLTLAGMTPDDFDIRYLEVPDLETIDGLPGAFDLVAISSYTAQIKDAYRLADRYRAAGTKVVVGGLHVTTMPFEATKHADSVVLGEGELLWHELLDDFRHGDLKPFYDGRGRSFNLAEAPMPRYDLLDPRRYNRLTVQTQRGCPHLCDFCASSILISPHYKVKPVEKVIAEVRRIKELWKHPFIEFADDNSFVDKAYAKALLRELAKEKVRWFTEADISISEDPELLNLMKESGCAQVLIGLESTSFSGLNGLEMHANWKAKKLGEYRRAIKTIQDHGITVNGCFVLGLDGTGTDSFGAIYEFVKQTRLYEVQITVLTPFPGTPLYERLESEGRILNKGAWELCTLFDVNFIPEKMTVSELETGLRTLLRQLYSKEFVQWRRQHFFDRQRRKMHAEIT